MTFVDTNVWMYAVGRPHPLQAEARAFCTSSYGTTGLRLCTSAEVLQELLHAYLPVGRLETLDAALRLVESTAQVVWAVEPDDVRLARSLVSRHPALRARDLLHLACCIRREVRQLRTYDRPLRSAAGGLLGA